MKGRFVGFTFAFAVAVSCLAADAWAQEEASSAASLAKEAASLAFEEEQTTPVSYVKPPASKADLPFEGANPNLPARPRPPVSASNGSLIDRNGYLILTGRNHEWARLSPGGLQQQARPQPVNGGEAQSALAQADTNSAEPVNQPPRRQFYQTSNDFRFRVGVDFLFFARSGASDFEFSTDGSNFSDFDFGTEADVRLNFQFMDDTGTGFELSFFDIGGFDAELASDSSDAVPTFFGGVPVNGGVFDANYRSEFRTIEVNAWAHQDVETRVGLGFRYFGLDEDLDILLSGSSNGFFSETDNDLWGFQILYDRKKTFNQFFGFDYGLKGGFLINRAEMFAEAANIEGGTENSNIGGFLNFFFGLNYRAAENIRFRIGYEGIGVFGVALAPDQSAQQDIFAGLVDPVRGSIYVGGLYIGGNVAF